jgi:leader peptidase (prepilin peptidase)/N-methyltransferase
VNEWLRLIAEYPLLWFSFLAIIGLYVGSFLNVVIHRLPIMQHHLWMKELHVLQGVAVEEPAAYSLLMPRSCCPNCQSKLAFYDMIPLLSWLWLRGRCRYCQQPIAKCYPVVELLSALVTVFFSSIFPFGWILLGVLLFSWFLLALVMIDLEIMQLPDPLTLPLLWLGLLFNLTGTYVALADAVLGVVLGYMILWLLFWGFKLITGREGLGYGDFKLLAALGAWLGWATLPSLLTLAAFLGIVLSLLNYWRGKTSLNSPMPFGPALALSAWFFMIYEHADWAYWLVN